MTQILLLINSLEIHDFLNKATPDGVKSMTYTKGFRAKQLICVKIKKKVIQEQGSHCNQSTSGSNRQNYFSIRLHTELLIPTFD